MVGGESPVMSTSDEHEVASNVLMALMEHQRLAREAGCASRFCEKCATVHRGRVARFVSRNAPIRLVLPAFAGKSPNRAKVLGAVPDMAEQLSLAFLKQLCDRIQGIYSPGARITICSDGRVFTDVVQFEDSDVTRYQAGLQEIIDQLGGGALDLFHLDQAFPGHTHEQMRWLLMEQHGEELEELKTKVSREADLLVLYRGLTRFLFEDLNTPDNTDSRAARQRQSRRRAYLLLQRSRAWGSLVTERFPDAVRLSIHPQPCSSAKLGIHLMAAPDPADNWMTPWHGTAVKISDRFVLMKRWEAEAMGADLVYVNGRPSHYVAGERPDRLIAAAREVPDLRAEPADTPSPTYSSLVG